MSAQRPLAVLTEKHAKTTRTKDISNKPSPLLSKIVQLLVITVFTLRAPKSKGGDKYCNEAIAVHSIRQTDNLPAR